MQDYVSPKPRAKKAGYLRWFVILFLILLFLGFLKRNLPGVTSLSLQKSKTPDKLLSEIKKLTDEAGGSWGVYVYDLTTNQGFGSNETTVFGAASVNKIPILASLYYLANRGEIDLDQQVTLQAEDVQDYGTGSIRYDPPGTTYSLKTLARLMMEKSDNTAAYILGRQIIGFDKIPKMLKAWGLTQTDMENDKTSLLDMAQLFSKMYRGEITNQPLTLEMIGLMDGSDFEDRIPALLPKEVKVYHKTGDGIGNINDVGIVNSGSHQYSDRKSFAYSQKSSAYFIGVLTSDITDEAVAKKTIAQISKLVFDYIIMD